MKPNLLKNQYILTIDNELSPNFFATFNHCIKFIARKNPKIAVKLIKEFSKSKKPIQINADSGRTYRFSPPLEFLKTFQLTEKFPGGNLKRGEGIGYMRRSGNRKKKHIILIKNLGV